MHRRESILPGLSRIQYPHFYVTPRAEVFVFNSCVPDTIIRTQV